MFAKSQKTTQNYFLAKGKIPSWALGISLLATLISSVTFLAYPGTGYSSNWILLVQGLMVPIVLLVVIWFIVPLFRKVINLSTYEYFERRSVHLRGIQFTGVCTEAVLGHGDCFFLLAVSLEK